MPAGKASAKEKDPTKDPDPALTEEELAQLAEVEEEVELPGVGEAVCFVEWDEARLSYFEYAALITMVESDGRVQMVVFTPHARSGRSFQGIQYSEESDSINPATHWRYPRAAAIPTFEEE